MRFRFLIWDFDGTLFDTYPALVDAIGHALTDLGAQADHDLIARLLTKTMAHCTYILAEQAGLDLGELEARIAHHRLAIPMEARPPFPGAVRVCAQFKAAGGTNYIYTHRDYASLRTFLDWQGVTALFDDFVTRDAGYPRKPSPLGFAALVEKHDLPPDAVLAIGDRDLDVIGAQRAGLKACLFAAHSGDGVRPDFHIDNFDALADILEL